VWGHHFSGQSMKLYVDMDGVVSDFDGYAQRELGIQPNPGYRFSQADWYKLKAFNQRIYRDIPVLPTAYSLIDQLRTIRDDHNLEMYFLTAVPKENDCPWSFWDKCNWAAQHFPGIPVFFGPYSVDKQKHYKPGDILIDDRVSNIEEWPGFSILHDYNNIDATISKLKEHLNI